MLAHRLILVCACALACGGCLGPNLKAANLRDLGNGSFAGISIDTVGDLPDAEALDEARDRGLISGWRIDDRNFSVWGLEGGEVASFTIEFAMAIREEAELSPEYASIMEKIRAGIRAVGVIATPQPHVITGSTLAEQAASIGIEIGELALLASDMGPLFTTSREDWLAVIGPATGDKGPQLSAIAAVYLPAFFDTAEGFPRVRVADAERLAAEDPLKLAEWNIPLSVAAAAGSKKANALFARLESAADAEVAPRMNAIAAAFEPASIDAKLGLLRDAAAAAMDAKARCGKVPENTGRVFTRLRKQLLEDLAGEATRAKSVGHGYEADAYGALVAFLEVHASPEEISKSFHAPERVLSLGRSLTEMKLTPRIECHRDIQKEIASVEGPIHDFAKAVRTRLAAELHDLASACAAGGRHATACCRYFLAYGVRHGAAALATKPETLASVLGRVPRADDSDLILARREAVKLLAKLLPCVDLDSPQGMRAAWVYDNAVLFDEMAVETRLGLTTGNSTAQTRFARDAGAELLSLEITPAEITEITHSERVESASQTLSYSQSVSNNEAVNRWVEQMNALARKIESTSNAIGYAVEASQTVTGTLGFKELKYVGSSGNTDYYEETRPYETASSILARGAAAGRANDLSEELSRLRREYAELEQRRPPDTVVNSWTQVVTYPREFQEWQIKQQRTCRLKGATTNHESVGVHVQSPIYLRVAADASKCVEAQNDWRTEADLRGDQAFLDSTLPSYALFALRQCLFARIAAMEAEIDGGTLADEEKTVERYWLRYLFTDPKSTEDPNSAELAAIQEQRISAAFTGTGEPIPADAYLAAVEEAPASKPAASEPAPPATDDGIDPAELWAAAMTYYNADEYVKAEALFMHYLRKFPNHTVAWANLAFSRFELNDYAGALEATKKSIALSPNWTWGPLQVALILALQDDWDAASNQYDQCLARTPASEIEQSLGFARKKLSVHPDCQGLRKAIERLEGR